MCLWRYFSREISVEPTPKFSQRHLRRLFDAIEGLKSDPKLRDQYFDDPTAPITIEFYDPKKVWVEGFTPSVHYLEAKADKAIRTSSAGYVIPTCDYECEKTDAARHIPGLKKAMIVLPGDARSREAWYVAHRRKGLDRKMAELLSGPGRWIKGHS